MRPAQLADQRLDLSIQLPGLIAGPVRMIGQPRRAFPLITAKPAVHSLTGHPIPAGHLSDRRPGYDLHDGVIALLHDAQLHEHGPATSCRELRHGGACPGGRCQASGEANVSTISRSRTKLPSACLVPTVTTFSTVSRAHLRRARPDGPGRE